MKKLYLFVLLLVLSLSFTQPMFADVSGFLEELHRGGTQEYLNIESNTYSTVNNRDNDSELEINGGYVHTTCDSNAFAISSKAFDAVTLNDQQMATYDQLRIQPVPGLVFFQKANLGPGSMYACEGPFVGYAKFEVLSVEPATGSFPYRVIFRYEYTPGDGIYTFTTTKIGTGTGLVSANSGSISWNGNTGIAYYNSGNMVTLTADADSGSIFSGWSGEGCVGTGTCTVTMNSTKSVRAIFTTEAFAASSSAAFKSQIPIVPDGSITIDGSPSDWNTIQPMVSDSPIDSICGPGTDIKNFYLAKDSNYLYWRVDTSDGTFSFGTPADKKLLVLLFYQINGENGPYANGLTVNIGDPYSGYVSGRYDNQNWTGLYGGSEYGTVGTVAEGKIPLAEFAPFNIEYINAYYWKGPDAIPQCDDANRYFLQSCTYTYSAWSPCQPDGTQSRTVESSTPTGCTGTPVLTQACIYPPPPPPGYGTISGRVTNSSGTIGIPNVGVGISDKFGRGLPYGTSTDSDGRYSIDVPVGTTYKVQFIPPAGNGFDGNYYFRQWYLDGINYSPYFESAQYVTVNDGQTTYNINTRLVPGGAISGRVTDLNDNPLLNVGVWAIDHYGWWISGNGTDNNGEYLVNVPVGTWTIQFGPSNETEYIINEWFNNKPYRDLADLVTVALGTITTGINAQLETGGAISGRVTDPDGNGLANVIIDATDANGMWVNGSGTDAGGYYRFNILAGDYKVRFGTHLIPGNYVGAWYNNGDLVHVSFRQTTTVNAQLQMGATISGTVTDESGAPLSRVSVSAMDASGNRLGFTGAITDILGKYTIIVPAGEWKLNFDPWMLGGYYLQGYHANTINQSSVTPQNKLYGRGVFLSRCFV